MCTECCGECRNSVLLFTSPLYQLTIALAISISNGKIYTVQLYHTTRLVLVPENVEEKRTINIGSYTVEWETFHRECGCVCKKHTLWWKKGGCLMIFWDSFLKTQQKIYIKIHILTIMMRDGWLTWKIRWSIHSTKTGRDTILARRMSYSFWWWSKKAIKRQSNREKILGEKNININSNIKFSDDITCF